jgi:hypothetical protein
MRDHLVRSASRATIGLLIAVLVTLAGPVAPASSPQPVLAADRGFAVDLAAKGDFVAQKNLVQCVGASMQMMLNIIGPTADRSSGTQLSLQKLARSMSGPTRPGFERHGASVRGWMSGLNQLDAGPYRVVGADTLAEAMRTAALAILLTGKPVGLLVWHGRHAWVMSGFKATADPLHDTTFEVTAAVVLDPLYPFGSRTWGPSPKPGKALSVADVGRQFVPRRSGTWPGGIGIDPVWSLASLSGKYVLVIPYRAEPIARLLNVAL